MEKMTNSKALAFVLNMEGLELPADVREKLTNIKASIDKLTKFCYNSYTR